MLTFEEWRHTYADVFETDDAARAAWTAACNRGYRTGMQDTRALLSKGAWMELTGEQVASICKASAVLCRMGRYDEARVINALLAAHSAGAQNSVDDAFRTWKNDPRFYQWHTNDQHAALNFSAGWNAHVAAHPQPMPQTDAARDVLAERERCIKACESVRDRSCAPEHSWAVDDCIAEIERLDRAKGE